MTYAITDDDRFLRHKWAISGESMRMELAAHQMTFVRKWEKKQTESASFRCKAMGGAIEVAGTATEVR